MYSRLLKRWRIGKLQRIRQEQETTNQMIDRILKEQRRLYASTASTQCIIESPDGWDALIRNERVLAQHKAIEARLKKESAKLERQLASPSM